MESSAIPAVFLHNSVAVVIVLILSAFMRFRWLVTLIAWALTISVSFLWKDIGSAWYFAWQKYISGPIWEGGLWKDSVTDAEIIGVLIFWLLPLGLAYATALARIAKIAK